MKEEWKKIIYKDTDVLEISNFGEVKRNGKILNQFENQDGYLCVSIKGNAEKNPWRSVQVGILVGMAFIPKPNNRDVFEINHKDYNRKNNNLCNLEWLTHADNVRYSICNKPNMNGENNPNYGNKKLSKIYQENKELSLKKQSRKGTQNGRCKKLIMIKDGLLIKEFDYIGLCCKFLVDNKISKCKEYESVRSRIRESIKYDRKYYGYNFRYDN